VRANVCSVETRWDVVPHGEGSRVTVHLQVPFSKVRCAGKHLCTSCCARKVPGVACTPFAAAAIRLCIHPHVVSLACSLRSVRCSLLPPACSLQRTVWKGFIEKGTFDSTLESMHAWRTMVRGRAGRLRRLCSLPAKA